MAATSRYVAIKLLLVIPPKPPHVTSKDRDKLTNFCSKNSVVRPGLMYAVESAAAKTLIWMPAVQKEFDAIKRK